VAGAGTFFALGWRTPGQFVRERVMRLVLPLAAAHIVLLLVGRMYHVVPRLPDLVLAPCPAAVPLASRVIGSPAHGAARPARFRPRRRAALRDPHRGPDGRGIGRGFRRARLGRVRVLPRLLRGRVRGPGRRSTDRGGPA
jgi:hypothetical protein